MNAASEITAPEIAVDPETGEVLAYDKLLFGTGSMPFIIPLPGHDLNGVIAYRDLEDTERMMGMGAGHKVVVIGGGLLGLEAAAGMAARGADVTVVHIMGHLMERQLDAAAGYLLREALIKKGITVLCGANSKEIAGEDGQVQPPVPHAADDRFARQARAMQEEQQKDGGRHAIACIDRSLSGHRQQRGDEHAHACAHRFEIVDDHRDLGDDAGEALLDLRQQHGIAASELIVQLNDPWT